MTEGLPPPNLEPGEPEGAPPPPPPERYPFWNYFDLLVFCGLAVAAFFIGSLFLGLIALIAHVPVTAKPGAAAVLAAQAIIYLLLFGALALMLRVQYDRPFWRSLAWTEMRIPPLWVVILGLATAFVVVLVAALIHTPTTKNALTELMKDRTSLLLMTLFGITLGPLCEELAFRGFLQPLLVRSFGAAPGILAAAIPFGLLHYREYGNSWRHALVVAAAGAAFGWMRHATGSTKAATLMHASYNALFFAAVLAQRK